MSFFPDLEKRSPEVILDFQNKQLVLLMKYVAKESPFYKRHFAEHGIDPAKIITVSDLSLVPPTTKDNLQQSNWDFLCVPKNRIIEYTTTSGTLGRPVTLALTENDLQRLAYNEAISFACAGVTSDDIVQLMLTLDRQFMAGLAYHEGARKLGAGIVRIGPGVPALQWQSIESIKPTVLIGIPSFIIKLIDFAIENKIDYRNSSVKTIICIGEGIRLPDLKLNALGERIKNIWDVNLISTYASTEMQTAFTECEHERGGHLHPELLILEMLDEQNQPVKSGEVGEITITTLGVEAMPLVRYKTGDMAIAFTESCACGRNTVRISPLTGRKQQMLKVKGTTFYPQAIFNILQKSDLVKDFVVVATLTSTGQDAVTVFVCADRESEAKKQLEEQFKSGLRIIPDIVFTTQAEIEKRQNQAGSRKVQKFIDLR